MIGFVYAFYTTRIDHAKQRSELLRGSNRRSKAGESQELAKAEDGATAKDVESPIREHEVDICLEMRLRARYSSIVSRVPSYSSADNRSSRHCLL
ncbi:hypothetical protein BST61_g7078 [Cercospora zeina]